MYPHRIRLRGPWEVETSDGQLRSVKFPILWNDLVGERRGLSPPTSDPSTAESWSAGTSPAARPTVARRSFGAPSRLDAHERVWLIGEGLAGPAEAVLNESRLGEFRDESFGVDVTALLGARNRLELRLGPTTREVETPIDVALEIRASAWLESLRLVRDAGMWLEGLVVGESAEPLEIHVVADRHGCGDLTTTASLAGTPFRLRLDRDALAVRVELIHVSSIWWAADVFAGPETCPG
jgi:hypothetical protein